MLICTSQTKKIFVIFLNKSKANKKKKLKQIKAKQILNEKLLLQIHTFVATNLNLWGRVCCGFFSGCFGDPRIHRQGGYAGYTKLSVGVN